MKHTLIILALITASIQTFAQSPRIKLNQITKDSLTGSVLISSPTDSGMVYSRDLFISYGADTVLILGGDTLISSVLSDGVTITGDGTLGSELTVDTATVIATKGDLDLYYLDSNPDGYTSNTGTVTSVGGTGTVNGISLSGTVTSSGDLTLGGTLSGVDLASQVTGTLPVANGGTGSATQNFVDLTSAQTVGGAKTFTSTLTQSGGDVNFDSNTFFVDESENRVGIGTSSPNEILDVTANINSGVIMKFQNSNVGNIASSRVRVITNDSAMAQMAVFNSGFCCDAFGRNASSRAFFTGANDGGSNLIDVNFGAIPNVPVIFGNNNAEKMRINTDGELMIGYTSDNGPYKLQVNSQIFATNATIATSDIKYKTNILDLENGLDLLMRLKPKTYDFRQNPIHNFSSETQVGFIAQEVQEVFSNKNYLNSIIYQNNGYLGMAYEKIIPITVKAIQEQQAIIESQATEIETLKTLITELSNRLQILENN